MISDIVDLKLHSNAMYLINIILFSERRLYSVKRCNNESIYLSKFNVNDGSLIIDFIYHLNVIKS